MTDDALAGLFAPFGLRITAGDITLRVWNPDPIFGSMRRGAGSGR